MNRAIKFFPAAIIFGAVMLGAAKVKTNTQVNRIDKAYVSGFEAGCVNAGKPVDVCHSAATAIDHQRDVKEPNK